MLGAEVREVSIAMHSVGPAIWMGVGAEGMVRSLYFAPSLHFVDHRIQVNQMLEGRLANSDLAVTSMVDKMVTKQCANHFVKYFMANFGDTHVFR